MDVVKKVDAVGGKINTKTKLEGNNFSLSFQLNGGKIGIPVYD